MKLEVLEQDFSVCKLASADGADLSRDFTFFARTDDEISLVCPTARVPIGVVKAEHGFKALRICGVLDFGLTGILSGISGLLAENRIAVFVISTYNTDYLFVKREHIGRAVRILKNGGYEIQGAPPSEPPAGA